MKLQPQTDITAKPLSTQRLAAIERLESRIIGPGENPGNAATLVVQQAIIVDLLAHIMWLQDKFNDEDL